MPVIRDPYRAAVDAVSSRVGRKVAAEQRAKPPRRGPPTDPAEKAAYFRKMADDCADMKLAAGYRELAAEIDPEPTETEKCAEADRYDDLARTASSPAEASELGGIAAGIRKEIRS